MGEAAGLLDELLRRRIVILTGKGGVGKSTTAAALALIAAERGKRVLLIEVDAKGNVPDFFDSRRVGFKPRRLYPGVYGLAMEPQQSMREYLHIFLRVPGFSLKPLEGFITYVSQAVPGLKEMLITGKIAWEARAQEEGRPRWDLVLVDGAPTGHIVSQLGAAREVMQLVKSGPIHDQSEWMADMFEDQSQTAVVLVAIPEEMPARETIDLAGRLRKSARIRPMGLILNQQQPDLVPPGRRRDLNDLILGQRRQEFVARHPQGEPLVLAGEIMLDARQRTDHYRTMIKRSLKLPAIEVPFVFQRKHGLAFTRALAEAIETEA